MNIEERNEDNLAVTSFRASMGLGMGVIYIILGIVALTIKYFGNVQLEPWKSYLLGGALITYGAFRLWRGIQDFKIRKASRDRRVK